MAWRERVRALGGLLLLPAAMAGCNPQTIETPPATSASDTLQLVRSVPLAVSGPSDMCLDRDGVHWWTVSDNTGRVYKLRLSDCAVVDSLSYRGSDPEGVWQDPDDGTLYVTEERTREIVHLDATGAVLGRAAVAGLGGDANSGLEGITSGPVRGQFFLLQEKKPARLVQVDAAGQILALHMVAYVGDLSGVTHDPRNGRLVVVSDESRKVCWIDTTSALISSWNTGVEKGEGIAIDAARGRLYVVSDNLERFFEFHLPGLDGAATLKAGYLLAAKSIRDCAPGAAAASWRARRTGPGGHALDTGWQRGGS
jgi:hypothetical protein